MKLPANTLKSMAIAAVSIPFISIAGPADRQQQQVTTIEISKDSGQQIITDLIGLGVDKVLIDKRQLHLKLTKWTKLSKKQQRALASRLLVERLKCKASPVGPFGPHGDDCPGCGLG